MKTLVISDIHSNIYALDAIWQHEHDSDLVVCAGDLVDCGPFPREVLDWIRRHNVLCVQGNHDYWIAATARQIAGQPPLPPEQQGWAYHNAVRLDEDDLRFLEQLSTAQAIELDGIRYGLTHLYHDYDTIVSAYAFEQFVAERFGAQHDTPITRLIMGHTHRQHNALLGDDRCWLNPGSVSYRRADDPTQHAHYVTIIDRHISLRQVAYDLAPLVQEVERLEMKEDERAMALGFWGLR